MSEPADTTQTLRAQDGTQIAYDDSGGSGTAVVLVHGITESSESLRPVADRLTDAGHRVITLDLRGHGRSGSAPSYDLGSMAADVVAVCDATGAERPHLVGHSLGGVVVSAVGASLPVTSVTNVDQALRLGAFKDQLTPVEAMLRDAESFPAVIAGLFEQLAGSMLSATERARISALRRPDQEVVLGVWDLIFSEPVDSIDATVAEALAGYRQEPVPYLALFGVDPGPDYAEWLASTVPGAITEVWADHGHYPHLVDLDRFITRVESFWAEASGPGAAGDTN